MEPQTPPQPVQPVQPTEQFVEPKSSFAWIKTLLVIILLILVGSGAYYFGTLQTQKLNSYNSIIPTSVPSISPTDQTANWQTYSYSYFSMQLPSDWKGFGEGNPTQFVNYDINTAAGRSFDSNLDKGKLKIEVYKTESGDNLRRYLDLQKQQANSWTETETKVNGLPAVKVKTSNPGFVVYTQSSISEKIISIAFALDFDNYQELATQILATFKFKN